jgi:hypothetical protein
LRGCSPAQQTLRPARADAALLAARLLLLARCFPPQALRATWQGWGYAVTREAFTCAPHAFLGAIPLAVLAYIRALRLYHRRPLLAFATFALGAGLFVAEVVAYREVLDGLGVFPLATGAAAAALSAVGLGRGADTPRPQA